jgi:hypothetical protein
MTAKPLVKLIKRNKRMKLESKKELPQKVSMKIIRILVNIMQNLYSDKLENIEEIDKCTDRYDLPKLDQEVISHLNRSVKTMRLQQ